MKKIVKTISTCFDEKSTAKDLLLLKLDRRKALKRHIENNSFQEYYQLIVKYLLSINKSKDEIKKIVRRHIALVLYIIQRDIDSSHDAYLYEEFDEVLNNDTVSIDFFDEEILLYYFEPICKLYNAESYEEIKCAKKELLKYFDEEWAKSLLNVTTDYFYYGGCGFADLKYYNHTDLLVPFGINNLDFEAFDFDVLDDDYMKNYVSTISFKEEDIKEKILGHIINIIFSNNNLDFKNDMSVKKSYYYEIMFNIIRKKIINDTYSFFEVDFKKQTARININEIKKPFKFIYNGEKYIFNKDGIKKI